MECGIRFLKLSTIITEITYILTDTLERIATKDRVYTSLQECMQNKKKELGKLKCTGKLTNIQYDTAVGTNSEKDVSLTTTLLLELFESDLKPFEKFAVKAIRDVRNALFHISEMSEVTDGMFQRSYQTLEMHAYSLAKSNGGGVDELMKIKDIFQKGIIFNSVTKKNHCSFFFFFPVVDTCFSMVIFFWFKF